MGGRERRSGAAKNHSPLLEKEIPTYKQPPEAVKQSIMETEVCNIRPKSKLGHLPQSDLLKLLHINLKEAYMKLQQQTSPLQMRFLRLQKMIHRKLQRIQHDLEKQDDRPISRTKWPWRFMFLKNLKEN